MTEPTQEEFIDNQKTFNTLLLKLHAAHVIEARWIWRITIFNLIAIIFMLLSPFAKSADFNAIERYYGIPHNLLHAICTVESGLKNGSYQPNDGGSPSYGICQIKAVAAKQVGWKGKNSKELLHGDTAVTYAAKYLRYQYSRYGNWASAIFAYNAGRIVLDFCGNVVNIKYGRKVLDACQKLKCQLSFSN